jgi:hypothetical protein
MPHATEGNDAVLDPIFIGALIATVSATILIFVAAHQNPVQSNRAARAHVSRAAANAAEERKIWTRRPSDDDR